MDRIAVVGKTGSGKTTLARTLSVRLSLEHIELDAISWGPNWTMIPWDEFIAKVESRTRVSRWVSDGNYKEVRAYVWGRADTLIWLDYPLPLVLWRLVVRTAYRYLRHEVLWGTNVERLHDVFGPESLFAYAVRSHRKHRADYPLLFQRPEYRHLNILTFKTPAELNKWLLEKDLRGLV